jgi:hypothetical protein
MTWSKCWLAAALLALSSAAAAGGGDEGICADRPSKSTGTCTVPEGRFQIETGLIDWTHDRSAGETTDLTVLGSSLLKYGVSDRADVELGVTPLELLRVHGSERRERASSFGDTLLRVKYRLTRDGAPVELALDPFVKLPTANHRLGNGKVEGGLVAPISAELGKSRLTVSLDPELDLLADEDRHGRHLSMTQVFNLGASLSE